ncbi:MAG TPA: DUF2179 domain-containing protein [Candidatus Pseudogracilibacillus intestinigallinarum]|uniref:UPF0316 protein H9895_07650 n=1 Tax=Candidatus Pseudogracilibacillus intestinigallinarum TaxID=2838742 RepID=A0A9D1PMT0_9BACI|nr:DUF2179 domain-containing protein [Candidatus Pseudogracilibacillus intestinigallinarum]
MLNNAYAVVAIILVINIIYVTFLTIRMILTLKGRKYLAAIVSVFEVVVYIMGLSIVLDNLDGIQNIIAYALGFALGIITGSFIEEKLALGYITVNVVSGDPSLNFSERLRKEGYGVTSWRSSGRDGDRLSMQILTPRKYELNLYKIISDIDPKAFIMSYEPTQIHGGFWVKQIRKGKLTNVPPENPIIQSEIDKEFTKQEENEQ